MSEQARKSLVHWNVYGQRRRNEPGQLAVDVESHLDRDPNQELRLLYDGLLDVAG